MNLVNVCYGVESISKEAHSFVGYNLLVNNGFVFNSKDSDMRGKLCHILKMPNPKPI